MGTSVVDLPMPRVSRASRRIIEADRNSNSRSCPAREQTLRAGCPTLTASGYNSLMAQPKSTATSRQKVIARALQSVRFSRLKILFIPEPGLTQHGGG